MRSDRGSAGIWLLALSLVLALTATGGVLVGAAVLARHRAAAAADLAALAAAGRELDGPVLACAAAGEVVESMGAVLDSCVFAGAVVQVAVHVALNLGRLGERVARGSARAGPADPPG